MRFVLVHSPLVGPATWRWVADELVQAGHEVAVPDLRAASVTGDPAAIISAAAAVVGDGPVVVAGHSGAGSLLPSIAAGASRVHLVFVDAGVPACSGAVRTGAEFLTWLRSLAIGGVLPKWSTWWGEGVIEALVPDEPRRQQIVDELPEVPVALYESSFTAPAGWCQMPAAFLLLSDAYQVDADTARSRDWPVLERLGNHLDLVNRPSAIADAIIELTT